MFAHCRTCNTWITGCAYWPLNNSIWLHRSGCPGAKIKRYDNPVNVDGATYDAATDTWSRNGRVIRPSVAR